MATYKGRECIWAGLPGADGNGYVPRRDLEVGPASGRCGTDVSLSRRKGKGRIGTRRGANQGRSQETGVRSDQNQNQNQVAGASGHRRPRVDFMLRSPDGGGKAEVNDSLLFM